MLILILDIKLLWPLPRFSETNIALSSNTIALCFIFFYFRSQASFLKVHYTLTSIHTKKSYTDFDICLHFPQTSNLDIWRDQESYKVVAICLHSLPKQRPDIWPDQRSRWRPGIVCRLHHLASDQGTWARVFSHYLHKTFTSDQTRDRDHVVPAMLDYKGLLSKYSPPLIEFM